MFFHKQFTKDNTLSGGYWDGPVVLWYIRGRYWIVARFVIVMIDGSLRLMCHADSVLIK
jgi:hypothetical protein